MDTSDEYGSLRRLPVDIGEHAEIRAAWLRFPELDNQANEQLFVRLAPNRRRYRFGPYDLVLVVSDDGVVLEYGEDLWRAEAVVRTPELMCDQRSPSLEKSGAPERLARYRRLC